MAVAGALIAGTIVWATTQPLRDEARRQLQEAAALRAKSESAGLEGRELAARRGDVGRLNRSLTAMESALQQSNQREESLRRRLAALTGGRPELVGPPATKTPMRPPPAPQRPNVLSAVQDRASPTASGLGAVGGVRLLSPVGTYLREDRPTFTWSAFQDATSYELVIYTAQGQEIAREIGITEPRRALARSLPRGKVYRWEIIGYGGGREIARGPASGSVAPLFGIFSAAQLQIAELAELESRLTRATGFAKAGLLDEADAELDAIARSAASPSARRRAKALRDEIRRWRQ